MQETEREKNEEEEVEVQFFWLMKSKQPLFDDGR